MAQQDVKQEQIEQQAQELTDIEIAELARQKLNEKDKEIANLKKDLAKQKLLTETPSEDEEDELPTKEECIKTLGSSSTTNYDYAVAVCRLVDIETEEGRPNPLGVNGDEVYKFFKGVIEDCNGDKSRFTSIYQAKIGNDRPEDVRAYTTSKKR